VVRELKVKVGDKLSEGSVVALIEAEGEAAASQAANAKARAQGRTPPPTPPPRRRPRNRRARRTVARPRNRSHRAAEHRRRRRRRARVARQQARRRRRSAAAAVAAGGVRCRRPAAGQGAVRESRGAPVRARLGVDLAQMQGSGRKGASSRKDVQQFVKRALSAAVAPGRGGAAGGGLQLLPWPHVDFSKFGEIEVKPLTRIQKISGANLARNWAMIPHVTQHDDADITELEALRVALNKENEKSGPQAHDARLPDEGVTVALKQFPNFNASLDASGENLTLKKYFHVGCRRHAERPRRARRARRDKKGVLQIAKETRRTRRARRARQAVAGDMSGGAFSISSLGGIGGTSFTPIVNAPEVAILRRVEVRDEPVWDGKQFQPRLILPLSLSYDHRVIDGAAAARFTAFLAQLLGDMRRAMLL
jgi:pyruvate dehydrogenase E2 component (dihydrolipoamide acetyltransferase)